MSCLLNKTPKIIKTNTLDKYFENLVYFSIITYIFSLSFISSILAFNQIVGSFYHILMYLSFLTIMIKIPYDFLRGKYTYLETIIYLVLCVLGLYCWKFNGFGELLVFYSYIISCKDIDKDRFIRCAFYSTLISLLLVVILSLLPCFPVRRWLFTRYGEKRYRYGLGFNFATYAPNFLLSLTFLSIFIKEKHNKLFYILIIILNVFLFIATDTKSAFVCVLLILLLIFNINNYNISEKFCKIFGFITAISYPIGAITIFLLSYFYSNENVILNKLNGIFSGRLRLANDGFKTWGIRLLGTATHMTTGNNYNFVDSSYLNILFNYGLINFLIIILTYTCVSYIAFKRIDKRMMIFLLVLSLHSILDPQLVAIVYNPVIALLILYIFSNKSKIDV